VFSASSAENGKNCSAFVDPIQAECLGIWAEIVSDLHSFDCSIDGCGYSALPGSTNPFGGREFQAVTKKVKKSS
jgi:hypothetical protein